MTITTNSTRNSTLQNAELATVHQVPVGQPATRNRRDDVAAVPAAVRSEWIKMWSIRSNAAILAMSVGIGILLSWILATFVRIDPDTHKAFTIVPTFIFSSWLSTVLAAVAGTLLFTSEVQHGTLSAAITAQPARWVTVGAKAAVVAVFGFAMGVTGMIAGFTGSALGGLHTGDTSDVGAMIGWGLFLTTLAAVFGLGAGMIIRHSSAAVSAVLVWTLVLENLLRSILPANVSRFLPFSAANGLLSIHSLGDSPKTIAAALSRPQDALLFGAYTIAVIVIGTALLYRRDAD